MKRKTYFVVGSVALLGLTVIFAQTAPPGFISPAAYLRRDVLYFDNSEVFQKLDGTEATLAETAALAEASTNGTAPPAGFVRVEGKGRIKAVYTGLINPTTGTKQISVSVSDELVDLEEAWLHYNGIQIAHATISNGGVIHDTGSGLALATMTFFPEANTAGDSIRLSWTSATSGIEESSITLP